MRLFVLVTINAEGMVGKMFEEMKEKYPRWMFVSVVGSQNYGTAIEGSDTDVKVAYLPTFEEFYRNKFVHSDTGSPDGDDYTVHPAHEFLRHAFKGNMNFWEVFFSNSFEVNWKFWNESGEMRMFFAHCRDIVTMNSHNNFNAMRGMAMQKYKEAMRLSDAGGYTGFKHITDVDRNARMWKAAQHSMRMLDMLLAYHCDGNLHLDLTKHGKYDWEDWRNPSGHPADTRFVEYVDFYNSTLQQVDDLESSFISHASEADVRSDRERYQWNVDNIMMRLILENS